MKISVFFSPKEQPENLKGTAVGIDALRASSTITTALAHGAKSIRPVLSAEEAFMLTQKSPGALLGGERKGMKIHGFHLGNSPREYSRETVQNKKIIFTTTNGTQAIGRARESGLEKIYVGCFLNLSALLEKLANNPTELYLFCSGRNGAFSLEDAAFAGLLCQRLGKIYQLADTAKAALAIWKMWDGRVLDLLAACEHGRYLEEIGLGSDLSLCAAVDKYSVVPVLVGEELISAVE